MFIVDNDEKVVSSKKHTQFKTGVQKLYPIFKGPKWPNRYPAFMTKTAEKPYFSGPHIPIELTHPHPRTPDRKGGLDCNRSVDCIC